MKLGQIEGTKEEITGFFQDNGLKVNDYFQMVIDNIFGQLIALPINCQHFRPLNHLFLHFRYEPLWFHLFAVPGQ